MEITARVQGITRDIKTQDYLVTLATAQNPVGIEELHGDLTVSLKIKRNRRSKDANALLWACIGELANALEDDPWELYLQMLRRYGQFTYIVVPKKAVDLTKRQWRETMIIGECEVGGKESVQMLCFFGSHLYDTKEFSRLLNGVIGEMEDAGLKPPPSGDLKRALEKWEEQHEKHSAG